MGFDEYNKEVALPCSYRGPLSERAFGREARL